MKKLYILILLFLTAYLVLFPQKLNQSISLQRLWVADLSTGLDSADTASFDGELIKSTRYISKLSENGASKALEAIRYEAVVLPEYYLNYDSVSQMLLVNDDTGMFHAKLDTRGYPFQKKKRLFVLSTDRGAMKEYTVDGDLLGRYSFPSVLTSVDVTDDYILAGFLDGTLSLYNTSYGIQFSAVPSTYHVTYGVAAAEEKNMFAAVIGLDPQYLAVYVYEPDSNTFMQRHLLELNTDFRDPVYIDFFNSDKFLAVQSLKGISVYDTEKWTEVIDADLDEFVSMFFQGDEPLFLFTDGGGHFSAKSPDSLFEITSSLGDVGVFRLLPFGGDEFVMLHEDTVYRFTLNYPGDVDE